jgi:surface antigen
MNRPFRLGSGPFSQYAQRDNTKARLSTTLEGLTMKSNILRLSIAGLAAISLAACAGDYRNSPKEMGGTLVGAGIGGLLGSKIGGGKGQLAAVAAGTILGGLLGNSVGRSLDRADQAYATRTAHQTLETAPTGTVAQWTNPDTGHAGTFKPVRTYQTNQGQYCREYQQTVTVGGQVQSAYGTACRKPDGSWDIQS